MKYSSTFSILSIMFSCSLLSAGEHRLYPPADQEQAEALNAQLGPAFTAGLGELPKYQVVVDSLEAACPGQAHPDGVPIVIGEAYTPELGDFARACVDRLRSGPVVETRDVDAYNTVLANIETDIADESLSLDALSFYCLSASIANNPHARSDNELFGALQAYMAYSDGTNHLWEMRYLEAFAAFTSTFENKENLDRDAAKIYHFGNLVFRPSEKGFYAFPYFGEPNESPLFGYKTFFEALRGRVAMYAMPLTADATTVHAGIVREGEFAQATFHDLLHMMQFVGDNDASVNAAIVHTAGQVLSTIVGDDMPPLPLRQAKALYGATFLQMHELVSNGMKPDLRIEQRSDLIGYLSAVHADAAQIIFKYFPEELGDKQAYDAMMARHSAMQFPFPDMRSLETSTYDYEFIEPTPENPCPYFTEDQRVFLTKDPSLWTPEEIQNAADMERHKGKRALQLTCSYTDASGKEYESTYRGVNTNYDFETQRRFAYSIVAIMRDVYDGDLSWLGDTPETTDWCGARIAMSGFLSHVHHMLLSKGAEMEGLLAQMKMIKMQTEVGQ